jgi:hypothetical protein
MDQEVLNRFKDIQTQIDDIAQWKNPSSVQNRLEEMNNRIEDVTAIMTQISLKLQTLDFDKKFLEEFSDEDMKNLYLESGLKIDDVAEFLRQNKFQGVTDFNGTAYKYVNGQIKELDRRSIVGKFLRYHALKKRVA